MPSKNYIQPYSAIFLIWLFHISGIIGISMGHQQWFIEKTPLNLLACIALFVLIFPMNTIKKWMIFGLFFCVSIFAEWLGANHSLLFGSYDYGNNLGTKIDGVPLFIGVNWALLTFITAVIAKKMHQNFWIKSLIGASLMVLLDIFMEQLAPQFDFWSFGDHVPLENYITWFVLAFIFQLIYNKAEIKGNYAISFNLFSAQVVFFGFFVLFPI